MTAYPLKQCRSLLQRIEGSLTDWDEFLSIDIYNLTSMFHLSYPVDQWIQKWPVLLFHQMNTNMRFTPLSIGFLIISFSASCTRCRSYFISLCINFISLSQFVNDHFKRNFNQNLSRTRYLQLRLLQTHDTRQWLHNKWNMQIPRKNLIRNEWKGHNLGYSRMLVIHLRNI